MFDRIRDVLGELRGWRPILRTSRRNLAEYTLHSKKRVDPELARQLYYNENDEYKLGGAFPKPIINAVVGFMGVPEVDVPGDMAAEEVLKDFAGRHYEVMQRTHRDAIRDGRCYVRLTREYVEDDILYPERDVVINYHILPDESVVEVTKDPVTQKPVEYVIETQHTVEGRTATVTQIITPDSIEVTGSSGLPDGLSGVYEQPWGFIPIVPFTNEDEAYTDEPRSDLEGVEPYIKAYHDVFKHAIQGSKLHSTPRLKLHVKDLAAFLRNNFGVADPKEFIRKEKKINLQDKDLLIFTQEDEDAQFVEAQSATGNAEALLHLIFYCIVEHSETPEFCFGAHLPANYASVKEQIPVLIRRVGRKRAGFDTSWSTLGRYVLAMTALAEVRSFDTHEVQLQWDEIDPRDKSDKAQELTRVVSALTAAIDRNIVSRQSAVDYLGTLVDTMRPYEVEDAEGEWDRIRRDIEQLDNLIQDVGDNGVPVTEMNTGELNDVDVERVLAEAARKRGVGYEYQNTE